VQIRYHTGCENRIQYTVSTITRLLQITRLFCRIQFFDRALLQETYDLKEPTNRSHPIPYRIHQTFGHPTLTCANIALVAFDFERFRTTSKKIGVCFVGCVVLVWGGDNLQARLNVGSFWHSKLTKIKPFCERDLTFY